MFTSDDIRSYYYVKELTDYLICKIVKLYHGLHRKEIILHLETQGDK